MSAVCWFCCFMGQIKLTLFPFILCFHRWKELITTKVLVFEYEVTIRQFKAILTYIHDASWGEAYVYMYTFACVYAYIYREKEGTEFSFPSQHLYLSFKIFEVVYCIRCSIFVMSALWLSFVVRANLSTRKWSLKIFSGLDCIFSSALYMIAQLCVSLTLYKLVYQTQTISVYFWNRIGCSFSLEWLTRGNLQHNLFDYRY